MHPGLRASLAALAATPVLLVACDYDGTLAEIVEDPALARPHPDAIQALRALGEVPSTTISIVSGRSIGDLVRLLGTGGPEYIVGSHGAEWMQAGVFLSAEQQLLLERLAGAIAPIARSNPRLVLERKPAGVALHVRSVEEALGESITASALRACSGIPGVHVKHGSKVVEFMVVNANKGEAVARARRDTGATGVIFIGDDATDEDVFATLAAPDVSIRVGNGATSALHRVPGVHEVALALRQLASLRRATPANF